MEPVTKKCTICQSIKPKEEFASKGRSKSGKQIISGRCRKCDNIRTDIKNKKRFNTKEGFANRIMKSQNSRSKRKGFPPPTYTPSELREWLLSQEAFHKIFDEWVLSGYDKWKIPSCDRLDDYKGYSLDNIRIVTWRENAEKYISDKINGINNKKNIEISQYSLSGEFIKKFYSIREASRKTGTRPSNISYCRLGKQKTTNGFIWK